MLVWGAVWQGRVPASGFYDVAEEGAQIELELIAPLHALPAFRAAETRAAGVRVVGDDSHRSKLHQALAPLACQAPHAARPLRAQWYHSIDAPSTFRPQLLGRFPGEPPRQARLESIATYDPSSATSLLGAAILAGRQGPSGAHASQWRPFPRRATPFPPQSLNPPFSAPQWRDGLPTPATQDVVSTRRFHGNSAISRAFTHTSLGQRSVHSAVAASLMWKEEGARAAYWLLGKQPGATRATFLLGYTLASTTQTGYQRH